jgi:hypothetical protein
MAKFAIDNQDAGGNSTIDKGVKFRDNDKLDKQEEIMTKMPSKPLK